MPFDTPIYAGDTTSVGSRTVDLSTVIAGRGVVLWAAQEVNVTSPTLTLTDSAPWTRPPDTGQTAGGWSSNVYSTWYIAPGSTIPASVQINSNGNGVFLAYAIPFYDIDVAVLDVPAVRGGNASVTQFDIPSVTTVTDNVELLVVFSTEEWVDVVYGAGLTPLAHNREFTGSISTSFTIGAATETWATAGATGTRNVNPDVSVARRMYGVMLPLKPATVAGTAHTRTIRGTRTGTF